LFLFDVPYEDLTKEATIKPIAERKIVPILSMNIFELSLVVFFVAPAAAKATSLDMFAAAEER
jgi:hypothetical protein